MRMAIGAGGAARPTSPFPRHPSDGHTLLMRRATAACACACLGAVQAACAVSVHGVVYIDRNGDHLRQDDEPVVPDAIVMLDSGAAVARTNRKGAYSIAAPAGG